MRERQTCSVVVVTKDGRVLHYEDVKLLKYHHRSGTLRVQFDINAEIREFKTVQLIEYNDLEVRL